MNRVTKEDKVLKDIVAEKIDATNKHLGDAVSAIENLERDLEELYRRDADEQTRVLISDIGSRKTALIQSIEHFKTVIQSLQAGTPNPMEAFKSLSWQEMERGIKLRKKYDRN